MSNSYFQFKQFAIHQQYCAMKVCTDACLFGAWLAQLAGTHLPIKYVLDIGAGTGLLSLMLAQKNNVNIDAVEIDKDAAQQAAQNIVASPWKENVTIYNKSLQQFLPTKTYDLIISNPPFFEGDLRSADTKRNLALHSQELTFAELLSFAKMHTNDNGLLAVLLPFARTEEFIKLAQQHHFYLTKKAFVKQTPRHAYFRSMLFFGKKIAAVSEEIITIKEADNTYSTAFTKLLKDYYLHL